MLDVQRVSVSYGNLFGVRDLSLAVGQGEIVTLIGANGAGKSTILNAISGVFPLSTGTIHFGGRNIGGLAAYDIVRLGISQVPEGRRIFGRLSVAENMSLGAITRPRSKSLRDDSERILDLFPRLRERLRQTAGTLSGGEQQMLAMARALMSRPDLLLLDEPSMGLAPMLVDVIFETIVTINRQGVAVLLVEQNAYAALEISARAYVLAGGSIVLSGSSRDVMNHEQVVSAYLGDA